MGRNSLPHHGAYRDCLDNRDRFVEDPHLALGFLEGVGEVLIFDPHSQIPKSQWQNGRRPPGLAARHQFTYRRSVLIEYMKVQEVKDLIVVHGGRNGSFWKDWVNEHFSDCDPLFLDRNEAISLLSPPSLNK